MSAKLRGFVLFAILATTIGTVPAFAQIIEPVVVTTDKQSYAGGETIMVSGEVRDFLSNTPVTLQLFAPNGNRVSFDQMTIGSDKLFSSEIGTGGPLWKLTGTYTIKVQYGLPSRTAETTFEFTGGEASMPKPSVSPTTAVENTDFSVTYSITGGKTIAIEDDVEATSLIIRIDASEDGDLTLTLPRGLIDAILPNGDDDEFFVLIDGEESEDITETKTSTDRTLVISFLAGDEEIEIIGTFIVPEFGVIAVMILAVALVSIIAVSAKTRLRILPKF